MRVSGNFVDASTDFSYWTRFWRNTERRNLFTKNSGETICFKCNSKYGFHYKETTFCCSFNVWVNNILFYKNRILLLLPCSSCSSCCFCCSSCWSSLFPRLSPKSAIVDRFFSSMCLNYRIDLPDNIGSF